MFDNFVLLFSLNNVFAFSAKKTVKKIYIFVSFVIVRRLNKDQFNASLYFVGVSGKILKIKFLHVWFLMNAKRILYRYQSN